MKSIRVAVTAAAVGLALTACSSPVEAGAAAVVGKERISANALNANVKEYEAALAKAKLDPKQLGVPVTQLVLYQMVGTSQARQLAQTAAVQVTEGEIDQYIVASEQQAKESGQNAPIAQLMLQNGIGPSQIREYMRTKLAVQKAAQKFGGGTDEAAQQRGQQELQAQAAKIKISYSPRYGVYNPAPSQEKPYLFSGSDRFGTPPAATQEQQPQQQG